MSEIDNKTEKVDMNEEQPERQKGYNELVAEVEQIRNTAISEARAKRDKEMHDIEKTAYDARKAIAEAYKSREKDIEREYIITKGNIDDIKRIAIARLRKEFKV